MRIHHPKHQAAAILHAALLATALLGLWLLVDAILPGSGSGPLSTVAPVERAPLLRLPARTATGGETSGAGICFAPALPIPLPRPLLPPRTRLNVQRPSRA